jgi:hypothetical protein
MILYRPLNADVPRHYEKNAHWHVEYDAGSLYHPLGIACVTAFDSGVAWIDRLLFADGFGHGIVTAALERACLERWPQIRFVTPGAWLQLSFARDRFRIAKLVREIPPCFRFPGNRRRR